MKVKRMSFMQRKKLADWVIQEAVSLAGKTGKEIASLASEALGLIVSPRAVYYIGDEIGITPWRQQEAVNNNDRIALLEGEIADLKRRVEALTSQVEVAVYGKQGKLAGIGQADPLAPPIFNSPQLEGGVGYAER